MIGSADCASDRLAATRAGWHRVAEHILAPALHRATGHIGLVPAPGGFRTPSFGTDARFLAVDGTELVVSGATGTKRTPLITVRAAAEFTGVTPGAPAGDDHITDPYVYVGPHDGPPPGDPAFWNAPFGAARTFRQVGLVAEAAAFFRDGRARVLAHAATNPTRRTS